MFKKLFTKIPKLMSIPNINLGITYKEGIDYAKDIGIDTSIVKFIPSISFYTIDTNNNIINNFVSTYNVQTKHEMLEIINKINNSAFTYVYYNQNNIFVDSFNSNSNRWRLYIGPYNRKGKISKVLN
jgi:hypothetical protein